MRILLLSEDGSKDARPTLEALVKKMLRLVDGQCRTNALRFEPPDEAVATIVGGNRWKSTNPRDHQKIVALVRTLATKLAEQPPGFVMFHVDGDCRWSERDRSRTPTQFRQSIAARVRDLLSDKHRDWTSSEIDYCMKRLLLLVPFYSIEAWTYQNTRRARELCHKHHGGRDADRFEAWERDRASLDEVEKPKEQTCLASKHNRDLAERAFPHVEAHDAGRSFRTAVDALRACQDLRDALRATYDGRGNDMDVEPGDEAGGSPAPDIESH
jgi:hypothetical protein